MSVDRPIVLPGSEGYWNAYALGREAEEVFAGQDVTDFLYACEYNGQGPLTDGVGLDGILMVQQGDNDGPNWIWLVRTSTGAHWWAVGGCDYTGWDCQSWLEWSRYDVIDVEEAPQAALPQGDEPEVERWRKHALSLTKVIDAMLATGAFTSTHKEILDEVKEALR